MTNNHSLFWFKVELRIRANFTPYMCLIGLVAFMLAVTFMQVIGLAVISGILVYFCRRWFERWDARLMDTFLASQEIQNYARPIYQTAAEAVARAGGKLQDEAGDSNILMPTAMYVYVHFQSIYTSE